MCILVTIPNYIFVEAFLYVLQKPRHIFQVVQEYERAVIFRLGRLLSGGAKGPGMQIYIKFKKYIFTFLNFTSFYMISYFCYQFQIMTLIESDYIGFFPIFFILNVFIFPRYIFHPTVHRFICASRSSNPHLRCASTRGRIR